MTPIGILLALATIFTSMVLDHGQPASLINIPSILLVFGGTIGASIAGISKNDLKPIVGAFRIALKKGRSWSANEFTHHLMEASLIARTESLLSLQRMLPEAENDPFVNSGVELIMLTSDPDQVREVLDAELIGMRARHRIGIKFFQDMGGFAPTIGILGTVIGLVRVLANLSEPSKLGTAIASAFTATLWGVLTANVFWIPISNKLKRLSDDEVRRKELVIEGLIAVQEGLFGSKLRDRLYPFLTPRERTGNNQESKTSTHGEAAA